jgi:hypothetical protein
MNDPDRKWQPHEVYVHEADDGAFYISQIVQGPKGRYLLVQFDEAMIERAAKIADEAFAPGDGGEYPGWQWVKDATEQVLRAALEVTDDE